MVSTDRATVTLGLANDCISKGTGTSALDTSLSVNGHRPCTCLSARSDQPAGCVNEGMARLMYEGMARLMYEGMARLMYEGMARLLYPVNRSALTWTASNGTQRIHVHSGQE